MKVLNSSEKRVVCANPDSAFRYFAWPTVAYLPDGTLAMTASGFRLAHICPFGKAVICYSKDEGATWTRPAPVIDTPLDDRDAGITAFGNGRVILTSFNNTIRQQRVWNHAPIDGHDWSESPRRRFVEAYLDEIETRGDEERFLGSTYKISEDGGYTFGKLRRAPVTAPHGPCRLNDGSLLYVGRRFSANDEFDGGETPFIQVCRLNENDEFEVVSSIENIVDEADGLLQSCEPHAIQLPDGRILVHIRVQRYGIPEPVFTVYQSESRDGGHTFTRPRRLLARAPVPAFLRRAHLHVRLPRKALRHPRDALMGRRKHMGYRLHTRRVRPKRRPRLPRQRRTPGRPHPDRLLRKPRRRKRHHAKNLVLPYPLTPRRRGSVAPPHPLKKQTPPFVARLYGSFEDRTGDSNDLK